MVRDAQEINIPIMYFSTIKRSLHNKDAWQEVIHQVSEGACLEWNATGVILSDKALHLLL